jgi:hypothetical protein
MMIFRIRGLEAGQFSHRFALPDAALAAQGAVRKIADGPHPCRIGLTDATPGDEVILVNYEHHADSSPEKWEPVFGKGHAQPKRLLDI